MGGGLRAQCLDTETETILRRDVIVLIVVNLTARACSDLLTRVMVAEVLNPYTSLLLFGAFPTIWTPDGDPLYSVRTVSCFQHLLLSILLSRRSPSPRTAGIPHGLSHASPVPRGAHHIIARL